jgi:O-methyltransferase
VNESSAQEFVDDVVGRVLRGGQRVAVLGATPLAVRLVSALRSAGLGHRVVGIFDDDLSDRSETNGVSALKDMEFELLAVAGDRDKERLLDAFRQADARLPDVVIVGDAHFAFEDAALDEILAGQVVPSLANGYANSLIHLSQCLRFAATHSLRGDIAEFGTFKGGTTAVLALLAQRLGLPAIVYGFDTFNGFPPRRSVLDLYSHPGCVFTNLAAVRRNTEPLGNVKIIAGDIVETHAQLRSTPLILTFFDTDNYTPARAALPMCVEQTVVGGSIVFDHYTSIERFRYTLGERVAAKEVLADAGFLHLHGTGVFTRVFTRLPERM